MSLNGWVKSSGWETLPQNGPLRLIRSRTCRSQPCSAGCSPLLGARVSASVAATACLARARGCLLHSARRRSGRARIARQNKRGGPKALKAAHVPAELGGDIVSPQDGNPHRCTLVYLHGFRCHGHDYLSHDSELKVPWRLGEFYAPGLRAVLPTAPSLPQPWGDEMSSWYVYSAPESNKVGDMATLESVREQLDEVVESEIQRLGGEARRVFLGGCSQGCTVALDAYLRQASKFGLGGFVGSIGFLPSDEQGFAGADEALEELLQDVRQVQRPLWLQCALEDKDDVPWPLVESSLRRVDGRLPGLVARKLEGVDHGIGELEATILNEFLKEHASDSYYENDTNCSEEDYWDGMDIDIELDVGPSIPGINA